MATSWILWVLVAADGEWRAWERHYDTRLACEEVRQLITYRRESSIRAECRPEAKSGAKPAKKFFAAKQLSADF